jgi:hypothetical protein
MCDNIIVIAVRTIFTWFSVCSIFNDLTGTRDTRGAPVIFVDAGKPEWELPDFNSEEIARVCLYFFQIPRYVCIYSNRHFYQRIVLPLSSLIIV